MGESEIWAPVVGYEGLYEVSSLGRVRSLDRVEKTHTAKSSHVRKGRMKVLRENRYGYIRVSLYRHGQSKTFSVHRLVAMAFLGDPPPEKPLVLHGNGDRSDNIVSNLRWGNQSENILDAVRQGTHSESRKTQCPRGHDYSAENTYRNPTNGHRRCLTCWPH